MELPYGEYPELAPPEAACANCAKGRNGRNCCPAAGKVPKCAAWQRLAESDKPKPPEQTRLPISTASVSALVPTLITPDMAALAEQILRVWDINLGKGEFSQYSIINRSNPALGPCFPDSRPGRMSWERVCLRICCMSCGRCGCSPPERERNTQSTVSG